MNTPRRERVTVSRFAERLQKYRPHVQALNTETETQRFPRHAEGQKPPVAAWRCNLAALSQRRNLLFTAQGADIYVWAPRGSQQLLGSQPEMIIHPVLNQPLAGGYIQPSSPHKINHIIVDDLGVHEVLLLATDSGNVTGYNVEAIFSAIEHCVKFEHVRPFDGVKVRPFFAEYVYASAWGLATHKFARLIAVTSNSKTITVFAFAMVDELPEKETGYDFYEDSIVEEFGVLGQNWIRIVCQDQMIELRRQMPRHRKHNLRIHYVGHRHNIPCVSFANFDLDPNGMWMVSTDVSNKVLVWAVWESIHYLNSPIKGGFAGSMGWFVLPIDPRRVQRHNSKLDACGGELDEVKFGAHIVLKTPKMFDSQLDLSQTIYQAPKPLEPLADRVFSDCLVCPRPIRRSSSQTSSTRPSPVRFGSATVQYSHPKCRFEDGHAAESEIPNISSLRVIEGISDLIEEAQEHLKPTGGYDPSAKLEDTRSTMEEDIPLHPLKPTFFPVLQFTDSDITLTSYPCDSAFCITSEAPFAEFWHVMESFHDLRDRMNMIKYIPELGIVVVATQVGRVAIITLTWHATIGHSFRIDWILPFECQNVTDQVPLLGMAVSPMPGFEIPQDVPCVPPDYDPAEWLKFDYRVLHPENDAFDTSPSESSSPNPFTANTNQPQSPSGGQNDPDPATVLSTPECEMNNIDLDSENLDDELTVPASHALASAMYKPHEKWHGWHPNRHYRLILVFCNHKVMSYEFWHTWKR